MAYFKEIGTFEGELVTTKPDGTIRKLMNVDKNNSPGWKAGITLKKGISGVYEKYHQN